SYTSASARNRDSWRRERVLRAGHTAARPVPVDSRERAIHCLRRAWQIRQGKLEEAERQLNVARFGFDQLLERHVLAFADHAAEFYAGSGNDFRRALELARTNVANRPTSRAIKQAQAIAACAHEAVARSCATRSAGLSHAECTNL